MARPIRNNVDYFPLYCDSGRKMYFIEQKHGNDGYATWIKILTELAKAEYHYLNLKDEVQIMYLSAKCKIEVDKLEEIINDLVKLGEFNSDFWSEKILFSQKFVDSVSDAYKKRSNNPVSLQSLRIHLLSLGILKEGFSFKNEYKNPHTILEDNKEKDTKEKSFENLLNDLKKSTDWIEGLAKTYKMQPKQVWSKLYYWLNEQKLDSNLDRPIADIKTHFRRTLKIQNEQSQPDEVYKPREKRELTDEERADIELIKRDKKRRMALADLERGSNSKPLENSINKIIKK